MILPFVFVIQQIIKGAGNDTTWKACNNLPFIRPAAVFSS